MKIVYLHQYFVTPNENGATRSYWFTKKLVEKGHQVVVITSTHDLTNRESGRYLIEGVEVIYIKNSYSNNFSKLRRIVSFINFSIKSSLIVLKEKNIDLVFATSTPLTVAIPALIVKLTKCKPYIFEVRDLWPEFPIQIGAIKNRILICILKSFEKIIYKHASKIIALSPGMVNGIIDSGVGKNKIYLIPNMSKPDIFYKRPKLDSVFIKYGINKTKFNIIHFGSMGRANGLNYLVEVAKLLNKNKITDVEILLVGKGSTLNDILFDINKYNLSNIRYIGSFDSYQMSEIVNCCDLSIVSFLNLPILQTNSPNKLFDSLSAGIPIVVNSAGWTKDLVEKYNCGFYTDYDNPEDFVNKIYDIKDNSELLTLWSANSRKISEELFDKEILSDKFYQIIKEYE